MNSKSFLTVALSCICAAGCVVVDTDLGNGYIPIEQQYRIRTVEFPLERIENRKITHMSGYSSRRITIGALRDGTFGLTVKSSAFTLVPVNDTLDFGESPEYRDFHISLQRDTISVLSDGDRRILQNIRVYSLEDAGKKLDSTSIYTSDLKRSDFEGCNLISKGTPVYNGGDSLSFSFNSDFGKAQFDKMLGLRNEDGLYVIDSVIRYTEKFPGIFLTCDEPAGNGGRLNFFDVDIAVSNGYVTGNYAELKFRSKFDGEVRDTSILFMFGAVSFPKMTSSSALPKQFAFNSIEEEGKVAEGTAKDVVYVEGGTGLKPVVTAAELRDLMRKALEEEGLNPDDSTIVINKASICIPYTMPAENYLDMKFFPEKLSPVCRIKSTNGDKVSYNYANLTDAAVTNEAQGDIDRSNMNYTADISFHAQKILWLRTDGGAPDEETLSNYDVWNLIMATEVTVTEDNSNSQTDYYNQLMYYNYLNSMYGGYGGYGYGGYGYGGYGYGGYGSYGYSNYYNMMMYYSMLNSGSTSSNTSTSSELDRDRFYRGILNGPTSSGAKPVLRFTFAYPDSALIPPTDK